MFQNQSIINNEQTVKYITRRVIERVLLGLHKNDKYIVVLYFLKEVYKDLFPKEVGFPINFVFDICLLKK